MGVSYLAGKDKFTFTVADKYIDYHSLSYKISIEVDFTKLSNYQELLTQLGLSDNYDTHEEKIESGYYTKLNEYYTENIKKYFPNGKNYMDKLLEENSSENISWLEKEQSTIFWYKNIEEANKEYDSLLNLSKHEEVIKINIIGYFELPTQKNIYYAE